MKKIFLSLLTLALITSVVISSIAFAAKKDAADAKADVQNTGSGAAVVDFEDPDEDVQNCLYAVPKEVKYDAQVISVRNKLMIDEGDKFSVKIFMKNSGNMPWFSSKSACTGPKMSLATDRGRDRVSPFYINAKSDKNTSWELSNRIRMDQERINPGEIASFTFEGDTEGLAPDIYKEYLTPLIDGKEWLIGAGTSYTVVIGDTGEDQTSVFQRMLYGSDSGRLSKINLAGEKKITIDLSEQNAYITLDDYPIRTFRVSSGAGDTPTPVGEYSIKLKQDERVGGKPPHYVMPKFMWFRDGGYGLHSLPKLRTDKGVFWNEARDHIGRPVSHGCVRMLPEDADFAFVFADIGTKVSVRR